MRILDVAPCSISPPRGGGAVRMRHLLGHLGERHEVRLFAQPRSSQGRPGGGVEARIAPGLLEHRHPGAVSAAVLEACRRSWVYQPVLAGAILRAARPRRLREWLAWCEVCLVEWPWQFAFCRRELPDRPVVLASHNVEVELRRAVATLAGRSPTRSPWVSYVERLERYAAAAADLVVAVSAADRAGLVERYGLDPARVVVVPNGSDTVAFRPRERAERSSLRRGLGLPERPTVLYLSAGPKLADLAGLGWVRRTAARLPGTTFLVVGGVSRPGVAGNVVATGFVEDAALYAGAADAAVAPIREGGGTKLKVWDALAAGLPTVVFAEAARGTGLGHGEHLLVVEPREDELVDALRLVLSEPELADGLGRAGRRFVAERHDWRTIATGLDEALTALVREGPRGSTGARGPRQRAVSLP